MFGYHTRETCRDNVLSIENICFSPEKLAEKNAMLIEGSCFSFSQKAWRDQSFVSYHGAF